MNEFEKIFNEMNLDRALLPILFRSNPIDSVEVFKRR